MDEISKFLVKRKGIYEMNLSIVSFDQYTSKWYF